MANNNQGDKGAGTNVTKNGGSSAPKTPSGAGSSNKSMPSSTNINQKGGGSIGVK